jgi:hypothetical protein
MQPGFQIVEDRPGLGLAEPDRRIGPSATDLFLDSVKPGDAFGPGDNQSLGLEDFRELAPSMRQTRYLEDAAGSVEFVETGIAVSM